jgi:hypothetical protein
MDPDQDLLDQLDRKAGPAMASVAAMVAGLSVAIGAVVYFTISLQSQANREIALDAAALVAIAAAVVLVTAFRKLR